MFTLSSAAAAQSGTQEIFANVASQKLTAFRATELLLMFATEIEYSIVQLGQEAGVLDVLRQKFVIKVNE